MKHDLKEKHKTKREAFKNEVTDSKKELEIREKNHFRNEG